MDLATDILRPSLMSWCTISGLLRPDHILVALVCSVAQLFQALYMAYNIHVARTDFVQMPASLPMRGGMAYL